MPNRWRDRMNQALKDLAQAEDSNEAGRHERACLAAQQAAGKAAKALHLHAGQEAWGHVGATRGPVRVRVHLSPMGRRLIRRRGSSPTMTGPRLRACEARMICGVSEDGH